MANPILGDDRHTLLDRMIRRHLFVIVFLQPLGGRGIRVRRFSVSAPLAHGTRVNFWPDYDRVSTALLGKTSCHFVQGQRDGVADWPPSFRVVGNSLNGKKREAGTPCPPPSPF